LSVGTWRQVGYWQSSYDLWTHALQVTTSNFVAEENLAVSLLDLGREDDAFPHFERVTALQPDDVVALLNAGNYLEKQGRHQEAIENFQHVVRVTHDPEKLTGAYRGLGVAYAQLGDRANARVNFLHALQLSPENPTELYNLSLLEIRDGIDNLTRKVSVKPTPEGYLQLGQLLQEDQRAGDAQLAYEKALRLNPNLSEARQALRDLKQSRE
jgi:tetratricopeptide (TPR) repeat protein